MEHRMNFATVSQLYQQFQVLTSYHEKIHFFDQHLGLLPFDPPPFDPALPWLVGSSPSFNLLDLFLLEVDRRKNFYKKTFTYEDQTFTFSVNPFSKNQRITLNQFILNKFLNGLVVWKRQVAKQATLLSVWEQQLDSANGLLTRIRELASEKNEQAMHTKFLQVFLKGYVDKNMHEQVVNRRKRFVELFLYAQGLLYSQYMEAVQKKILVLKGHQQVASPLLNQKLKVMEKLGLFSFLKTMLRNEIRSKTQLVREIHFLLSDSKSLPTSDENVLIENFLFSTVQFSNDKK